MEIIIGYILLVAVICFVVGRVIGWGMSDD